VTCVCCCCFADALETGTVTTVDLWPVSGRKHQLRKHCAERGHPILGEHRYGGSDFLALREIDELLCLWSLEVSFDHPAPELAKVHVSLEEPAYYEQVRQREQSSKQARIEASADPPAVS
jgi:23S rRNA-/tRNA-specific pseudouridylate synthase